MTESEARCVLPVAQPRADEPRTEEPRADESRAAPPAASLRALVRRGSFWSLAGYGATQALRLAGNLLLTRLLVPEAFGLMALVNALLQGLQLFSDVGIGPSIIQGRRGEDPAFLGTAWSVQALRGGVLFLAAVALALPFAAFYDQPMLAAVLAVSGSTALISGFQSTRLHRMVRQVDLARLSGIELASQAVALATMWAWAAIEPSIWALVAGGVVGSFVRLVLSHTALPGHPDRFAWDRSALEQLIRFGRWIFFSTVLSFFVGQSDRLVFGKMVPLGLLGVYSVGAMIATLPATVVGRMASSVLFPVYSRVWNSGQELGAVFTRVRRPVLLLAGWMIAGLCGGGAAAVRLLYDERYDQAGWIVQLVALGSWFGVLEATNGAALLARGEAHWTAASGAAKLAGMLVLIPVGHALFGFPGAVAGLALSEVLRYAVSAVAAAGAGLRGWPQDLLLSAWVLATSALGWVVTARAQEQGFAPLGVAALVCLVATLAWAPLATPFLGRRRASSRGGNP